MSNTATIDLITPPPRSTKYNSPVSKLRPPVAPRRLGNQKLVKQTESRFVPAITPNQLKTPARKVSRLQSAKDREIQRLKEDIKMKDVEITRLKVASGKVRKLLRKACRELERWNVEERQRKEVLEKLESFWGML
ncbi:hypothetical protein BDD12DRAFT_983163 [Trichophaea hybrida]|nr:hypothetical protein BDD12DRAFT_983163 [Trichophaea hybrida]